MMLNNCCCFAGSNLSGTKTDESDTAYIRILIKLASEIELMHQKGVDTFITGLKNITELWFSEIVLNLRRAYPERTLRLVTLLPNRDYLDHCMEQHQLRNLAVVEQADECIPLDQQLRNRHYGESNRYIVQNSGHFICLWGGAHDDTEYMIRFASESRLDMVMLYLRELS